MVASSVPCDITFVADTAIVELDVSVIFLIRFAWTAFPSFFHVAIEALPSAMHVYAAHLSNRIIIYYASSRRALGKPNNYLCIRVIETSSSRHTRLTHDTVVRNRWALRMPQSLDRSQTPVHALIRPYLSKSEHVQQLLMRVGSDLIFVSCSLVLVCVAVFPSLSLCSMCSALQPIMDNN